MLSRDEVCRIEREETLAKIPKTKKPPRDTSKRFEIIIKPLNDSYCGKCTYKTSRMESLGSFKFERWVCLLFMADLTIWGQDKKPWRCVECKKLTKNFEKMPELDEGEV